MVPKLLTADPAMQAMARDRPGLKRRVVSVHWHTPMCTPLPHIPNSAARTGGLNRPESTTSRLTHYALPVTAHGMLVPAGLFVALEDVKLLRADPRPPDQYRTIGAVRW
jgi:hypothetical protein